MSDEKTTIRYIGRDSEGVILDEHDTEFVFLPGEAVAVDPEVAERCLVQEANWELVGSPHSPPKTGGRKDAETPSAPVSPEATDSATTAPEAPAAPSVKE